MARSNLGMPSLAFTADSRQTEAGRLYNRSEEDETRIPLQKAIDDADYEHGHRDGADWPQTRAERRTRFNLRTKTDNPLSALLCATFTTEEAAAVAEAAAAVKAAVGRRVRKRKM